MSQKHGIREASTRNVVDRFQLRVALGRQYNGKFVTPEARLQWSDAEWLVEELPAKGKKKLRRGTMPNSGYIVRASPLLPSNVLREADLATSDSYDEIKAKIEAAMKAAIKACENVPSWVKRKDHAPAWYEGDVYHLEVTPENVDPFTVKGKDFTVQVEWSSFKAYAPSGSEGGEQEASYSLVEQKSAGAARKLYKILRTDPKVLQNVSWDKFTSWLTIQKVAYETRTSVWR